MARRSRVRIKARVRVGEGTLEQGLGLGRQDDS